MTDDRDWSAAPYVKVYRSVVADFGLVYRNKAQFGAWVSLLIEADAAYPAPAPLPRWLDDSVLDALVKAELVVIVDEDHYTVSGLLKERIAQERGRRVGGLARVDGAERDAKGRLLPRHSSPDIAGDAGLAGPVAGPSSLLDVAGDQHHQLPNRTEPILTDTNPSSAPDPADDYWTLTSRYPSDKVLGWLDSLSAEFGAAVVSRHLAERAREGGSTQTLLGRVQDSLRREARKLDLKEQSAERARVAANRAPKGVNVPLLIARHNNGAHADDADTNCPACRQGRAA